MTRRFRFEAHQWFGQPPGELFPFFADPGNLERITPGWLHFRILGSVESPVRAGVHIDYRLRWRGLPLRWRTRIDVWEPPFRFVDRQVRGPYRLWVHEHRLSPAEGGTMMRDRVDYAVPGGALIERLLVGPDVRRIFGYRRRRLAELLQPYDREASASD